MLRQPGTLIIRVASYPNFVKAGKKLEPVLGQSGPVQLTGLVLTLGVGDKDCFLEGKLIWKVS